MEPLPTPSTGPLSDPAYVNAMSHFYRGELGRMLSWRQRLDATTTWAITITSTIFTIAFTFRDVPHVIFVFNLAAVAIMLWIEARRYRFYDAYRARVRMLEAHFLVPIILQKNDLLQGDWKKLLCEDLILPTFKISAIEAVGRRLKRNYIFLVLTIQAAWLTKIFLHAPRPITAPADLWAAMAVGDFPGAIVAAIFFLTLVLVVVLMIYATRKTAGEFHEFGQSKALWRI